MKKIFKIDPQVVVFLSIIALSFWTKNTAPFPNQMLLLLGICLILAAANLIVFFVKGFYNRNWNNSYLLFIAFYVFIGLKFSYIYYNCFLYLALIVFSFWYIKSKSTSNQVLKSRMLSLSFISCILLLIPDRYVFMHSLSSSDNKFWTNRIKWSYFQGEATKEDTFDVAMYSFSKLVPSKANNYPRYITYSLMDCRKSYAKPGSAKKYYSKLLQHEQFHFNITEWTRREIEDSLSRFEGISLSELLDIEDYFIEFEDSLQYGYDSMTQHGSDYNAQIIWQRKITSNLNSLSHWE